ncbi:sigma-54-dependent Fis family transcriptional regulator [candidate division KSB1 bacterium]|nr:sigma-54-dependent Fis family transcriptional regulator [candidate division KSB1 bacterium]
MADANKTSNLESFGLIGDSEAFHQMMESIRQVAPTQITVLIQGESGTGKEVVARTLHKLSQRNSKPLLTVNCGAIPEGILESELFGHEKGAFTGAVDSRKGYFELAHEGTLFLDEIGEMPLNTQVKLLRVLEEQDFMRVGGNQMVKVDVRVIAATNRDLEGAVNRGEFRKDLFYRLNAVRIHVPSLRERKSDIRDLTLHFADEICRINHIQFHGFTREAFSAMEDYDWPGNIRELRNVVERILILEKGEKADGAMVQRHLKRIGFVVDPALPMIINKSSDQSERELIYRALLDIRIALEDLKTLMISYRPRQIEQYPVAHPADHDGTGINTNQEVVDFTIKNIEKRTIQSALLAHKGNKRKTAKALGIGERTLYRKLKEYDLE